MAIDALEFPELHDESIPAMAFIRHLTKLLQAAGVRDFSLKVPQPRMLAARGAKLSRRVILLSRHIKFTLCSRVFLSSMRIRCPLCMARSLPPGLRADLAAGSVQA
jgi:hypothetical protein